MVPRISLLSDEPSAEELTDESMGLWLASDVQGVSIQAVAEASAWASVPAESRLSRPVL